MVMGSQVAFATTYTPAGTHSYSQTVTVQKDGLPYSCTLNFDIVVPEAAPDIHGTFSHGHSATAINVSLSGGFPCTLIAISGEPFPVTLVGGTLTVGDANNPVRVTPPLSGGYCEGTLSGPLVNGVWELDAVIPKQGGINDCTVVGDVQIDPPLLITNP